MRRFIFSGLVCALAATTAGAEPLRVFVRGGPKTHGPGVHEHPRIVSEFAPLLAARGLRVETGMDWPSADQLAATDVLFMYAQNGGDATPEQQERVNAFIRRGGGLVVVHTAIVSKQEAWWKSVTGGTWVERKTKWREGPADLYFIENQYVSDPHPLTRGVSNFSLDDEIYYDLDLAPDIRVLASAFTPHMPGGRTSPGGVPHIHDSQPQMWVRETTAEGGSAPYRCVVSLPGHGWRTFETPHYRALLLRSIAWAGRLENLDAFNTPEEVAALLYPAGGPRRPQATRAALEVHPDFDLTLVAAEPLINKPINVDWDASGRMWIAETPEYPNGRRGMRPDYRGKEWRDRGGIDPTPGVQDRPGRDRISVLTDTDGDGVMDAKHVFHEGLDLVTGLVFHRDGVIVTQAPDILWIRDTDGDGRSDTTETLYTGLGTRDTHAVINNPRWGWDGWIYATHGYSGSGRVTGRDGKPVTIGSGVVRFRPDGSAIEQYTSKGGNTWGLSITGDNRVMWSQPTSGQLLMQTLLPESAIARIGADAPPGYHVVEPSLPVNPLMKWEQLAYIQIDLVGRFTAAAGAAIYDGGAWPAEYNGDFFTTEPTVNLVHHARLTPDGTSHTAARVAGREETEFIRSADMWWRPIETRVGPDGALYVLDFYNQAVIHNDTRGPHHNQVNAAVRPDRDHYFGRVWRVNHRQSVRNGVPDLARAAPARLAAALAHPNRAVRMNAHRLLAEQGGGAEAVAGQLAAPAPETRIAALWTLHRLAALSPAALDDALRDPDPAVRRNAAQLCAESAAPLRPGLAALLRDPQPPVRLAALLALQREHAGPGALADVAGVWPDLGDKFERGAALGIAARNGPALLQTALRAEPPAAPLALAAARAVAAAGSADEVATALVGIAGLPAGSAVDPAPLLKALAAAKTPPPASPATSAALLALLGGPASGAAMNLVTAWKRGDEFKEVMTTLAGRLRATLDDPAAAPEARLAAADTLLGLGATDPRALADVVARLPKLPAGLQAGLVRRLGETDNPGLGAQLAGAYPALDPAARTATFDVLLARSAWSLALLDAFAGGRVDAAAFDPVSLHRLRTHPDAAVARRASEVIDALVRPALAEKDKAIAAHLPEMSLPGDAANGKTLFTAACAICHQLDGAGTAIGPALDGMGAHSPGELLTHIIDPNREVDPSYSTWNITTRSGRLHAGVIVRENPATVVLRSLAGEEAIPVAEIATRANSGRSLMPEGLEALGPDALRDILAFLAAGADPRFRTLDLRRAFTASSARGLYADDHPEKSIDLVRAGTFTFGGVPFAVVTPEKSANGLNVINLKGGGRGTFARDRMPARVEIEGGGFRANRLHFLGGVGGWAYPFHRDVFPVMTATVEFADGSSEDFVFRNGVEFADHIGPREVPGSAFAEGVSRGFQVRWHSVAFKQTGEIRRVVLTSAESAVAPTTLAITAELAGADAPPLPAVKEPAVPAAMTWGEGTRVLLVGGGSSHDFAKYFDQADRAILSAAGGMSVNYTAAVEAAASALPEAKVVVISSNQGSLDSPVFRKALAGHLAAGRGVVILHPGTWYNLPRWPEYNRDLVGGGARGHDAIREFAVRAKRPDHPVMKGVPAEFRIVDELYHVTLDPAAKVEVLAETEVAQKTGQPHPSVWTVDHPHSRIVCIAPGHDARAHDHPAFRTLLVNAVRWAAR